MLSQTAITAIHVAVADAVGEEGVSSEQLYATIVGQIMEEVSANASLILAAMVGYGLIIEQDGTFLPGPQMELLKSAIAAHRDEMNGRGEGEEGEEDEEDEEQ